MVKEMSHCRRASFLINELHTHLDIRSQSGVALSIELASIVWFKKWKKFNELRNFPRQDVNE
jgi:hypothetical protein